MPSAPLILIASYLIGAIPFGLLIGLARGIDIREHGSRNIGATNAGRVLGRKWGFVCLALDILKGLAPTLVAGFLLVADRPTPESLGLWLLIGLAAVLGHVFPVYLGFRGGKGVATTIGVALGVFPYYTVAMLAALGAYGLGRFGSGIVSVGSLALAVAFPLAVCVYIAADPQLAFTDGWPLAAGAVIMGLLIIIRHTGNIQRLITGKEHRRA